jgi:hypothetical protein
MERARGGVLHGRSLPIPEHHHSKAPDAAQIASIKPAV